MVVKCDVTFFFPLTLRKTRGSLTARSCSGRTPTSASRQSGTSPSAWSVKMKTPYASRPQGMISDMNSRPEKRRRVCNFFVQNYCIAYYIMYLICRIKCVILFGSLKPKPLHFWVQSIASKKGCQIILCLNWLNFAHL